MNNWRIGATITRPNNRGSAFSSSSSFHTRMPMRRMSAPLPAQPDRCQGQHDHRKRREGGELAAERVEAHALQHDPAQRDQKVTRRYGVGDELKEPRHARNRKDEA